MEPRFFLPGARLEGLLTLMPEDETHAMRVLRMRDGEKLTVCDAEGSEALCERRGGGALVLSVRRCFGEPLRAIRLYPSVAKGERFEWMLQKAVELGAASVTPVMSARCVAGQPEAGRLERWRRIVREAACQTGRGIIPEVREPVNFSAAARAAAGTKIFCYEEAREGSLAHALRGGGELSVMTGPEGGYTPGEASLAASEGWLSVTLGARILRCETAPLFVLAAAGFAELTARGGS